MDLLKKETKSNSGQKLVKRRSLIKQTFSDDLLIELYRITMMDCSNNRKGKFVKKLLTERGIDYTGLGPGTNRMGVLIDGMACKIALDDDGKIDNKREILYTKDLQPYVIKCYECLYNGLLMICEYVELFTLSDLHAKQHEMRKILKDISEYYLIGDVGVIQKNYCNWGFRSDGTICILDYAYVYRSSYNIFKCDCDAESLLRYDSNYNKLVCPTCGKSFEFREIRRRITRKQQEKEIGDIRRLGYVLTKGEELVPYNPEFDPDRKPNKNKKLNKSELLYKKEKALYKLEKKVNRGDIDYNTYYDSIDEVNEYYDTLLNNLQGEL